MHRLVYCTCVDVGVLLHIRLLVKSLPAESASEGPGVRVDEQMSGEGGGPLEGLAALLALETSRHLHGVRLHVLLHRQRVTEGLPTRTTFVRASLFVVRSPYVHL